jgi:ABC-type transporter Mla subunit MlaD
MSISSVSGTPSPTTGGLVAFRYGHHPQAFVLPKAATSPTSADSSSGHANQPASTVAATLTQLGLTPLPAGLSAALAAIPASDGSDETAAQDETSLASQSQPRQAQQQVQQYKDVAATFSDVTKALNANSSSASSLAGSSNPVSTVMQDLWSSLGASSATFSAATSSTVPNLPTFLQTMAQSLGESGISGLHGVFVDAVV